jgi:dephospho-CoA kinase
MKLIGLTGGIGMGKSTSARFFHERGVPVVDTDTLARELVEPGQPSLEEIKNEFGADMVDSNGKLRRENLALKVFADRTAREKLEAILHPKIRERWRTQVERWRRENRKTAVVVIPLLFETDAQSEFDFIFCVACSARTQRTRLKERGWSESQIDQRIAAQWPVEKKIQNSNVVIWSDVPLEIHSAQLHRASLHRGV